MSDINRRCTGQIEGAGTDSSHYADGGGHAVDFYLLDGQALTGRRRQVGRAHRHPRPARPLRLRPRSGRLPRVDSAWQLRAVRRHLQPPAHRLRQREGLRPQVAAGRRGCAAPPLASGERGPDLPLRGARDGNSGPLSRGGAGERRPARRAKRPAARGRPGRQNRFRAAHCSRMTVLPSTMRPSSTIRSASSYATTHRPRSPRPRPRRRRRRYVGRGVRGREEVHAFGDRAGAHVEVEQVPQRADRHPELLGGLAADGVSGRRRRAARPPPRSSRPSGWPLTYAGSGTGGSAARCGHPGRRAGSWRRCRGRRSPGSASSTPRCGPEVERGPAQHVPAVGGHLDIPDAHIRVAVEVAPEQVQVGAAARIG